MPDLALVRFYACDGDRLAVALRLLSKALEQGHRTWVQGTEAELQGLSDALWLVPGFLAHAGPRSSLEVIQASALVLQAQAPSRQNEMQLWIGLGVQQDVEPLPAPRCFELVGPSEAERQLGRQRYRAYQAAGHQPESVRVRGP